MPVDFATLDPLKQRAYGSQKQLIEAQAGGMTLADKLREALTENFAQNPFLKQRETALQTFLTARPEEQTRIAEQQRQAQTALQTGMPGVPLLSPTQISSILSATQARAAAPLTSLNELISLGRTQLEDIIGSSTRAWQANIGTLQGQAELNRQILSDALNQLVQQAQLEQSAKEQTAAEEYRQAQLEESALDRAMRWQIAQLEEQGRAARGTGGGGELTPYQQYQIVADATNRDNYYVTVTNRIKAARTAQEIDTLIENIRKEIPTEYRDMLPSIETEASSVKRQMQPTGIIPSLTGTLSSLWQRLFPSK